MDTCDVLIAGGGPAGSACAWKLRQAGLDVVVIDGATFPRDKVCAGWITPQVIDDLDLDVNEYRRGRTFQPITGFRVGVIGKDREVETSYANPISFGIRRCEFDHYLLERSGARLRLGTPVTSIEQTGGRWVVNDAVSAPMIVGAGGHFCPVARWLNGPIGSGDRVPLVVAQEAEFAVEPGAAASFATDPERPELYFCGDLKGYGWCFRKGDYLNLGFGRLDRRSVPKATAEFVAFLAAKGRIPPNASWRWRGHAYLLYESPHRRVCDAGVLLVGDAAGLAYPQSGEGIRPAVESGLLAADTILHADHQYGADALEPYAVHLRARFGTSPGSRLLSHTVPARVLAPVARTLLKVPVLVRHLVLNRWFLHAHQPALALSR
jgi:geranylgeranyl reductase family protein